MRDPQSVLPADDTARLVGRVHDPEVDGPSVVAIKGDRVIDLSRSVAAMSDLLDQPHPWDVVQAADPNVGWPLADVLAATVEHDLRRPRLLAPIDLQVIKAAGVTFAESLLERVIEERAGGDPSRAASIRSEVEQLIGSEISGLTPGSPEAAALAEQLKKQGLWSQYLEVGIGPDPEIFTKAPVLSAVGTGAAIGVRATSTWNNPEPELVLAVDSRGRIVGAALGNDVNLRDVEGRSALLLGQAKDNNASCALGPFIRLLDETFTAERLRGIDVRMTVRGEDGFELDEVSSVAQMSRDLSDLVSHAFGRHHQYPDGFVLFTGTLFAPTQDRGADGRGFTHHEGDVVQISAPELGTLTNTVTTSEAAPPWTDGIRVLMANLAGRGLLTPGPA